MKDVLLSILLIRCLDIFGWKCSPAPELATCQYLPIPANTCQLSSLTIPMNTNVQGPYTKIVILRSEATKNPSAPAPTIANKFLKHSINTKQYYLPVYCTELAEKI